MIPSWPQRYYNTITFCTARSTQISSNILQLSFFWVYIFFNGVSFGFALKPLPHSHFEAVLWNKPSVLYLPPSTSLLFEELELQVVIDQLHSLLSQLERSLSSDHSHRNVSVMSAPLCRSPGGRCSSPSKTCDRHRTTQDRTGEMSASISSSLFIAGSKRTRKDLEVTLVGTSTTHREQGTFHSLLIFWVGKPSLWSPVVAIVPKRLAVSVRNPCAHTNYCPTR